MQIKRLKENLMLVYKFMRREPKGEKNSRLKLGELQAYEALRRHRLMSTWPSLYYETLDNVIELVKAQSFLEIGVAFGWHAEHILDKFGHINYFGVDPYTANYDPNDHFSQDVWKLLGGSDVQDSMDFLYSLVFESNKARFGDRFNLERDSSQRYLKSISTQFDVVFADGNHKYEFVLSDLQQGWNLTSPGGVLCGDDFHWPEVKAAVETFSQIIGMRPVLVSNYQESYPIYLFCKKG
jgi:predicted O-methyltransferase YrrM